MAIWLSPFEHLARINAGLYLESGFYDLRSPGRCTADAYKPALLQYDAATSVYVAGTITPLQGVVNLIRKFWEVDTPYQVGDRITPYSEGDLTQIWECTVAGTSGSADPAWDSVTPGNITDDGPDVKWSYDPGFDGGLAEEPFDGEALVAGLLSQSVGCAILQDEVLDPCGTNWVSLVGPAYCPLIFPMKEAQYKTPASTYSGKLRLFVQALYGSLRSDYSSFGTEVKIGGLVQEYPEITLKREFAGNSWIYTTADYRYFLCTYEGGALTFKPMDLSEEGRRFRDTLLLHSKLGDFEWVTKVEAYILSTAQVNGTAHSTVVITGDVINGSPLDHGWHVKWEGNEATVVTFYKDPLAAQYISDQHQLTISETGDFQTGYVFTAANTRLISNKPWWPRTQGLQVFFYNVQRQTMEALPYPDPTPGGFTGAFDAPIYCFYEFDAATGLDTLNTANIYMDLDPSPADVNIDLTLTPRLSADDHVFFDKETQSGAKGTKGFKLNGNPVEILQRSTSFRQTQEATVIVDTVMDGTSGLFFGNSGDPSPMSLGTPDNPTDWAVSLGRSYGETRDVGNGTEYFKFMKYRFVWSFENIAYGSGEATGGSAFFQIVMGDCAKVVIGKSVSSSHSGKSIGLSLNVDKFFGGDAFWSDTDMSGLSPGTRRGIQPLPGPYVVSRQNAYVDNLNPGPFETTIEDDNTANPEVVQDIFESFQGNLREVPSPPGDFSLYFGPTVSFPWTNSVDYARKSIHGLAKTEHSKFAADDGFLNDSSVGWA